MFVVFLRLVLERAAHHSTCNGADESVPELVAAKAARGTTGKRAHQSAIAFASFAGSTAGALAIILRLAVSVGWVLAVRALLRELLLRRLSAVAAAVALWVAVVLLLGGVRVAVWVLAVLEATLLWGTVVSLLLLVTRLVAVGRSSWRRVSTLLRWIRRVAAVALLLLLLRVARIALLALVRISAIPALLRILVVAV